jgi:acetyltransferase-like isoleucine patch superfamily enzyme
MSLARGVSIEKGTILALGDKFNGYGALTIGINTWIGQYNNLRMSKDAHISIGEGCLISQFCSLIAANHVVDRYIPIQKSPCDTRKTGITIGNDVWLGAGVTVLPGVVLGEGVVIGANSVVNSSVAPYEIWAGTPAHRVGERS